MAAAHGTYHIAAARNSRWKGDNELIMNSRRHRLLLLAAATTTLVASSSCGRAPSAAAATPLAEREQLALANASIHGETKTGNPLPAGTEIKVRPNSRISGSLVAAGESITVQVAEEVKVSGQARVLAGTEAVLSVVDSDPGTQRGSVASLTLRLRELRFGMVDRAQLHTSPVVLHPNQDTALLASAGPSGTPIGVEIPVDQVLTFKLESAAEIHRLKGR